MTTPMMHKVMVGPNEHRWAEGPLPYNGECVVRRVRLALPLVHFNPTLLFDGKELRIISRNSPCGSRLFQATLTGENYQVGPLLPLPLPHPLARGGQEDPRAFAHQGRWHIAYAGVQCVTGTSGDGVRVHQLLARLDHNALSAEQTWKPLYAKENNWEKNWGFFSWQGELFAVYSIKPHLVLHQFGDSMYPFSFTDWKPDWCGGWMRGGAAPVRHEGEYWSFFHGAADVANMPHRIYSLGCYVFEGKPPFRPLWYTKQPIALPPDPDWPLYLSDRAVFPCGAVMRGGMWLISAGAHNFYCDIYEIDHRKLVKGLAKA